MKPTWIAAGLALFATVVFAAEQRIALKAGAGRDKLEAGCGTCHSLDYIPMNSPFPNRALWEAEVNKMIKVFGAPISGDDAKEIIEYLAKEYGTP